GADIKWVRKNSIHMTLKFLGNVADDGINDVKAAMDEAVGQSKSFDMVLEGIGAFPKPSFPRVIWVGVEKGQTEAAEIAKILEDTLEVLGFAKEDRPFRTHITLGRVRSPKNKEALKDKVETIKIEKPLLQRVNSIILFKSDLTQQGPIYTKIHASPLP
ncbi:RNA 2',3'-cyclic phosphodiesterase, partial [Candidatus Omnitrophota bacterium]